MEKEIEPIKIKAYGLNKMNLSGSKFESMYGYSKFVKLKIKGKQALPVLSGAINMWGAKEEDRIKDKAYAEIKEKEDCLNIYAKSTNVEASGWVIGYPSIRLGDSIWGPRGNFELGQFKNYKKMKVLLKWDFNLNGSANLVFDIWLTKNRFGSLTEEDIEVMVWLEHGSKNRWEEIGKLKDISVRYIKKNKQWNNGGYGFAFIPPKNKKRAIDLYEIIKFCENKIKNMDEYWIRSIELGTEFSKNTEVNIKLYKLNFDFS